MKASLVPVGRVIIYTAKNEQPVLAIDLDNTGSRIEWHQVKPAEMTNLEYQDGGQSAFSIDK